MLRDWLSELPSAFRPLDDATSNTRLAFCDDNDHETGRCCTTGMQKPASPEMEELEVYEAYKGELQKLAHGYARDLSRGDIISCRGDAIYTGSRSYEAGTPDDDDGGFLRLAGLAMPRAMQSVSGIRTASTCEPTTAGPMACGFCVIILTVKVRSGNTLELMKRNKAGNSLLRKLLQT
ncbi:hypothetical protein WN55_03327 [Dufourea novaeangliae]|uniref:Uncharacterized protein n=1 Tax=Dufourea novaeangliae TaxID=178035 RepID=A0A154PM85_DUFNO|nr:hypothetical protein WN55_03327 [Dufourea novaeangliae]